MTALDAKLQLKPGQSIAVVGEGPALDIAAPASAPASAAAVLAFAVNSAELRSRLAVLAEVAGRGGLAWVAYPKARQLGTDLNRDVIRELAAHGDYPRTTARVPSCCSRLKRNSSFGPKT